MAEQHDTTLDRTANTELVDLLTRTQRALARDLGAFLDEENTSVEQWRVLRTLARVDDISMGELAVIVEIPHPTLTRIVDSLADSAYLYRSHSPRDRRRVSVHVSDLGRVKLARLESLARTHEQTLTARHGQDSIQALTALLADLWTARLPTT
ncbi:MarR family winged helix-turn-helix transcriptional regulator [Actinomadura soli]|uniref:MarR family winged helix-turn-helix transcriptional regulator n=1 Tax=Actinomadura soli TaxID=2508997 RepID=UPI00197AF6B0|nr:MarR family transcriptional regulator [Actinomadura soli]